MEESGGCYELMSDILRRVGSSSALKNGDMSLCALPLIAIADQIS